MADNSVTIPDSSSPQLTLNNEPTMASNEREGINSPYWRPRRALPAKALSGVMVAILLLFLADLSYLFGATFQANNRVNAMKVLVIDYDGGAAGQAVSKAYESLKGNSFPSLEFGSAADYPDPSDVKHSVCHADYWGAIYIHKGTSSRLAAAYAGGQDAEDYNPSDSLTYIYNGARYPTTASGYLAPNFQSLISVARASYYQTDEGRTALQSVNTSDSAAVQAYLNPFQGTADIIRPTNQASRNLYNTLNIVMAVLGQFFFVLAMNGLFDNFGIHKSMRVRDVWMMRFAIGKVFSCLFAVVVTGYIWAFREDWGVDAGQWFLTWLTFWLFMDTNFQVLESTIGSFVPLPAVPFFLLTWFIVNVSACMFPFELMAGFYRIGYAFPAHSLWIVLIQVWSGCGNYLRVGLPILFSWWVVGHVAAFFSIRKRCMDQSAKQASIDEEKQE